MLTQKSKKIKRYCALFFASLGVFSMASSGFDHSINTVDYVLLGLSLMPLSTNNRGLLLMLGGFGFLVSFFIGFTALFFSPELYASVSVLAYFTGFLAVLLSLSASFGLAYAALQTDDKSNFSLI
jgi:hypothetical protein